MILDTVSKTNGIHGSFRQWARDRSAASAARYAAAGRATMSYRFEAGRIYRMPTHFGPAPGPRQLPEGIARDAKRSPRRLSVAASFLTDPAALERHLPDGFTLAGEPVVTVEFHHMTDIDLARRAWLHDDLGELAGDVHRSARPRHGQLSRRRLGESRGPDHHRT